MKYNATLEDIEFAIRLKLYLSSSILYDNMPLRDVPIKELIETYFRLKGESNNDDLDYIDECDLDDLNL